MVTITTQEYHDHCRAYDGFCETCNDFTGMGVEPDAMGYECPACGQPTMMGTENAMVCMILDITD